MDLFGSPNIEKMAAEHDLDGLYKALENRDKLTRFQAAQALAEMDDGTGWRFLTEHLQESHDPDEQEVSAAILGELGHPRAIPFLEEALKKARGETADVIKEALEAIGGQAADEALTRAGYAPVPPYIGGDQQVTHYDAQFVRPVLPDTGQVAFLTAEQHYNNAVDLRESEMAERALVENSLALWLSPQWAEAWYVRGVIFEDLDRNFEGALCYNFALQLNPNLAEAREALGDLETDADDGLAPEEVELIEMEAQVEPEDQAADNLKLIDLLEGMTNREWTARRDAAAGLGDMGETIANTDAVDRLIDLLQDEEREVRHAAIEALGNIGDQRAIVPLMNQSEGSWLLRFATIEALSQLKSVEGVVTQLHREMQRNQERNVLFTSRKDPLLEVEYERVMEIGVLALERTSDMGALLNVAEENAWIVEDEDEAADEEYTSEEEAEDESSGLVIEYAPDYVDEEDAEDTEEENLESYVDEVGLMVCLAIERLAPQQINTLLEETLLHLAEVPDLSLMELLSDEEDAEPEPVIVRDLSTVRDMAKAELARRGKSLG